MIKLLTLLTTFGMFYSSVSAQSTSDILFNDYNPDNILTRAQAAEIFYNFIENKEYSENTLFSDVSTDTPEQEAIHALTYSGIISGFGDGTFRPDDALTEIQLLILCENITGYSAFCDNSLNWKEKYINNGMNYGFLNDIDFSPDDNITCQKAKKIIENILLLPIVVTEGLEFNTEKETLIPKISIQEDTFLKIYPK